MNCTLNCIHCGRQFPSTINVDGTLRKKQPKFCSDSCRGRYNLLKRMKHNVFCKHENFKNISCIKGLCISHYYASIYKAKPEKQKKCLHCGIEFIDKSGNKKFCQTRCGQLYRARLNGIQPAYRIKEVICKHCKKQFKPKTSDNVTFCSRDCSFLYQKKHGKKHGNAWKFQKTSQAKRKQRIKANGFERINKTKVFERDKWTCHICGCKTPKSKRGTFEMNAPEVDHIIPLAAGGSHTYGNVACACKRCNIKKSTKPLGQLNFGII